MWDSIGSILRKVFGLINVSPLNHVLGANNLNLSADSNSSILRRKKIGLSYDLAVNPRFQRK